MDIKDYDKLLNVAVINFYTVGKEKQKICLYNFNRKDERHLACVHIANIARQLFHYEFKIKIGIKNYFLLNWKMKSKKWLKRNNRPSEEYALVDVEDFIAHIERANELPDAFAGIYTEYFKRYDR